MPLASPQAAAATSMKSTSKMKFILMVSPLFFIQESEPELEAVSVCTDTAKLDLESSKSSHPLSPALSLPPPSLHPGVGNSLSTALGLSGCGCLAKGGGNRPSRRALKGPLLGGYLGPCCGVLPVFGGLGPEM